MPVWSSTKQWLIMKRQHQCIFTDIYLQNLKKTVKKGQQSGDMTAHKNLEKSMEGKIEKYRKSLHTKLYSIMHVSMKCWLVFSFPQWTKASMYNSRYTKTSPKYFIMIFSLQCSCLIMQHCTDSLSVHGQCVTNYYSWSRFTK